MKKALSLLWLVLCISCYGQKLPIDTSVLGTWPTMSQFGAAISKNGKYITYFIENRPFNNQTFTIQGVDNTWMRQFVGVDINSPFFTSDNAKCVFLLKDTLYIQSLGQDNAQILPGVLECQLPESVKGVWVAFTTRDGDTTLTIMNVITGKRSAFPSVSNFKFEGSGKWVLAKQRVKMAAGERERLELIEIPSLNVHTIWSDTSSGNCESSSYFKFSASGNQLAFMSSKINDRQVENQIWYYAAGMTKAELRANAGSPGMDSSLRIAGNPTFSKSGRWLFFDLEKKKKKEILGKNNNKVNIWSYKDIIVIPDRVVMEQRGRSLNAVVQSVGSRVVVINNDSEEVKIDESMVTGDYIVTGYYGDVVKYWWHSPLAPYYLVSLVNGARLPLTNPTIRYSGNVFYPSPGGGKLLYYDGRRNGFFCLDLTTMKTSGLTESLPIRVNGDRSAARTLNVANESVAGIAAWQSGDSSVLIYDQYDIWKLDLSEGRPPINVTNGFGRLHNIEFRLLDGPENPLDLTQTILHDTDKVILVAFNTASKLNGFFLKDLSVRGDPQLLTMDAVTYYMQQSQKPHGYSFSDGIRPIKAADLERWLVQRQSINDAPNFFITSDFRKYIRATNLQPQAKFTWMRDTLLSWSLSGNTIARGILYMPDQIRGGTKYPVIFNYYEQLSHTLNQFPYPQFTSGNINIPWFVAHGYLVFTPDITFRPGLTAGKAALISIMAAAKALCRLPYVDSTKMGLQGHSFGAFETNYVITHSRKFAAAAEFAGVTDPTSSYLTLTPFLSPVEHSENEALLETGHSNFGATLWQRPDVFLDNSAVLNADKVVTPLLITHNVSDNNIQWRQGVELYMALRRLNKPVWLLQYENSGHTVDGPDAADYTIRLTQFFDYFLKKSDPPQWMSNFNDHSNAGFGLDKTSDMPE